jgi:hypothetical protein
MRLRQSRGIWGGLSSCGNGLRIRFSVAGCWAWGKAAGLEFLAEPRTGKQRFLPLASPKYRAVENLLKTPKRTA